MHARHPPDQPVNDQPTNSHSGNDQLADAQELWAQLGDVPIDDDERIDESFLHFPKGTHREDIWHWFEDTFEVSVAYLMGVADTP